MQTLKISRQLSNLRLPLNLEIHHQKAYFNYNHWYKIEKERIQRINAKKKTYFNSNSYFDVLKMVAQETKKEFQKFIQETKENSKNERKLFLDHGDFQFLFKFNSPKEIENWIVSSDAGYGIGKSKGYLNLTQKNTALFHGHLSNEFDKPEKTNSLYTGYVNTTSLPKYKSFFRKEFLDLKEFNSFVMKVRGDGRSYMITLKNSHYFKETETYLFMHPLYTRGGPYWQTVKIPFSKFFHVTHGRVSDRQYRFVDNDVTNIGFTVMDGIEGPFSLEIDFIGVLKDEELKENLAYETYKTAKYISNT